MESSFTIYFPSQAAVKKTRLRTSFKYWWILIIISFSGINRIKDTSKIIIISTHLIVFNIKVLSLFVSWKTCPVSSAPRRFSHHLTRVTKRLPSADLRENTQLSSNLKCDVLHFEFFSRWKAIFLNQLGFADMWVLSLHVSRLVKLEIAYNRLARLKLLLGFLLWMSNTRASFNCSYKYGALNSVIIFCFWP